MDLHTAVAASMLPTTRGTVGAAFKELRHEHAGGAAFLDLLWSAAGRADVLAPGTVSEVMQAASRALDAAAGLGLTAISLCDARYPALLACTPDPPPVLWKRGTLDLVTLPSVAIVGSRAATPYALEVAARLAAELTQRQVVVVSGLARGVDSAAHRGCLDARGRTVAVLGSGLDRVYPPEHDDLAAEIAESGLLLSELGPGAPPLPEHFPLRNRIISGISLATVVVEASEHSGSLITARCAAQQGRDVMAVPGSILSGRNRGSHALLKDGAKVVETADDILEELGWISAGPSIPGRSLASDPLLLQMESGEEYELDELVAITGTEGARLLARLMELELAGLVGSSAGRFARRG